MGQGLFLIIVIIIFGAKGEKEFTSYKSLGCYKDNLNSPDLEYRSSLSLRKGGIIEECIQDCVEHYYPFAGIQRGKVCYCGLHYGKYGSSHECSIPCAEKDETHYYCGGLSSSVIYSTGIKASRVLTDLYLNKSKTNQLIVSWDPPEDLSNAIKGYVIRAKVKKSFDSTAYALGPMELSLSDTASSATILGLLPGTQYNISVAVQNSRDTGPSISGLFWTEIAKPEIPSTPILVSSEDDKKKGVLRVKIKPLDKNRYGPISRYRIIVIDESEKVPVYPDSFSDWYTASAENLRYWIAAELEPNYFDEKDEFLIGDQKYYGKYYNYGPLNTSLENSDYHVTLGVVSTHNDVTKTSYARVTHDQHSVENIVVFSFDSNEGLESKNSGPSLVVSLSIAVIVFGIVLGIIIGVYAYLRCGITLIKSNNNKCDAQELTPRKSTTEVPEVEEIGLSFTNPMVSNGNDQDETDSPASSASQMEAIRRQVWLIPRASLELSHEVIGRGKYGSVVNGHILKIPTYSNQSHESDFKVNVQVASSVESRKSLSRDLELVVRYGSHMNVLNLLGLSDGDELMNKTLFIVFEKTTQSLKRILVDSRALLHYPVYAEKNNRFTTLQENNVMDVLIGVARGMQHLVKNKILHKKLCARNIFLSPENVPKISGIGVAEYSEPGFENDYTRWFAQEAFKSNKYVPKCDVWSFAVLMWEVVTIGGTPYADLKTGVIPNRVQRGMRVAQTNYMSDDIYQTMLQCWQLDLDERPSFSELEEILNKYSQQQETLKHITFENYVGFQYEMYVPELEVKSVAPPNSQYV